MKKSYEKPSLKVVDLRPEEQIGKKCTPEYTGQNKKQNCTRNLGSS